MNLCSKSQTKLYGLDEELNELINLYNNSKLPNKILLSGEKGIGKCTLAYHLINYILSNNEENPYNINNLQINKDNHSFKLIQNNSNPNFNLIDINSEKKSIEINQIRSLINNLNKSSFNSKPRFILIDNIEFLNVNSINALLKILEEPNENTYFILINNNKKILSTLLSRCLNFRISLSNEKVSLINKLLFGDDIKNLINSDILDYYAADLTCLEGIETDNPNEVQPENYSIDHDLRDYCHNSKTYFSVGGDRIYITKKNDKIVKLSKVKKNSSESEEISFSLSL